MFKRDHIKTKLITFILANLALCLMFFILVPDKPTYGSIQMDFYGLAELVVIYPLLAAAYGVAVGATCFGDYAYAGLMGVIFFVCALANTLMYEIAEPPAAFVYTGICAIGFAAAAVVRRFAAGILGEYRAFKTRRNDEEHKQ